jgi:hypothetical protein
MLNDDGENMLDKWGRDSLCCFAVNWPYIGGRQRRLCWLQDSAL